MSECRTEVDRTAMARGIRIESFEDFLSVWKTRTVVKGMLRSNALKCFS
jgi:hypothetical protein